ncbi:MAG: NHL repeat-containing protein, partial [Coriobacteriia bacterium]|nr:NHL repeat-containing protein [Coriobacteriia bacterium]
MSRTFVRSTLIAAIVVLLVLLAAMSFLFVKTVSPPGVVQIPDTRMTWVRSIYGFGPSAEEQFAHPYSVAIDSNGDIYATDPERARILVFARHGDFKRIVHTGGGGTEPGMFQRPESIALDARDNLYIADSWGNKVVVFDPEGHFVREWSVPGQPRGIAVNSRQVYVLGPGTVYVYSAAGEALRQFGTRGKRPGQIDAYQGIAVRDGRVYIADSYNHRIQAFDTQGTLAWSSPAEAAVEVSTETSRAP